MANDSNAPLLQITNADVKRGDNCVFHQLNLTLERDTNYAVLGPNGAGKSTLLKLIFRELYPQPGGDIRVFGRNNWNVWQLRQHLGLVSHQLQHAYFPQAKGLNVVLSGYYSSDTTHSHQHFTPEQFEIARHYLQKLGINSLADREFQHLSTGQQRRFLLARALVNAPSVLILDEPTAGLDIRSQFEYLALLSDLLDKGTNAVLVTHHIQEIPHNISQIVLMKEGQIFAQGQKQTLFTSEVMSALYETHVHVVQHQGYYQLLPA